MGKGSSQVGEELWHCQGVRGSTGTSFLCHTGAGTTWSRVMGRKAQQQGWGLGVGIDGKFYLVWFWFGSWDLRRHFCTGWSFVSSSGSKNRAR